MSASLQYIQGANRSMNVGRFSIETKRRGVHTGKLFIKRYFNLLRVLIRIDL